MNIEVASRLAELRKEHGLSQEQLAERLNISRQAVSKWERAESSPDTDNLIALAKLYKVSLDELVKMDAESEADEQYARSIERQEQNAIAEEPKEGEDDFTFKWERGSAPIVNGKEVPMEKKDTGTAMNWIVFPYPVVVTMVYLLIGFLFHMWHPGWMLYLTIPVYYTAVEGDHFNLNKVPYPLLVLPIYCIMGFTWNLWHPGWIIFLTIPLYYPMKNKLIQNGLNLILIAVGVMAVFSMLGMMLGHFVRPLMILVGVALCAAGVYEALKK